MSKGALDIGVRCPWRDYFVPQQLILKCFVRGVRPHFGNKCKTAWLREKCKRNKQQDAASRALHFLRFGHWGYCQLLRNEKGWLTDACLDGQDMVVRLEISHSL